MKFILALGAFIPPVVLVVQKMRGRADVHCCSGATDASRDLRMAPAFKAEL